MNTEVQQLRREIDRVAGTTKFNEIPLMATLGTKGSYLSAAPVSLKLQVGWEVANAGSGRDKITISIANFWTGVSGNTGVFGQVAFRSGNGQVSIRNSAFSRIAITTTSAASRAVMKIDSALSRISTERADRKSVV